MRPDPFEQALTSLKQHASRRRRRARRLVRYGRTCLFVSVPAFLVALGLSVTGPAWAEYVCLFIAYGSILPFAITSLREFVRSNREEMQAAAVVAGFEDLRAVGPLAGELGHMDYDTTPLVVKALTRLLPRLRPPDADLLDADQRACLYRALESAADSTSDAYDVEFAVAILGAIGQVGDRRALRLVRRLASEEETTRNEARICAAAQACLPLLEARVHQTLLRPADVSAFAVPETLLRPAKNTADTPPERLLRPRTSDSDGDSDSDPV